MVCLESVREFRKYSFKLDENDRMYIGSAGYYEDQMRLFRAQRNFYISGFSIFGLFIIKRLANFISTQAKLSAEVEASLRQARNAAEQASQSLTTESDNEELNKRIKEYEKKIKSLENNLLAMKKQSESTNKAFDELTKKVAESEVSNSSFLSLSLSVLSYLFLPFLAAEGVTQR